MFKKISSMRKILLALTVAMLGVGLSPAADAFSITLQPALDKPVYKDGEWVYVDAIISDLGNEVPPALGAYDLDITYDPSILHLYDVFFGFGLQLFYPAVRGFDDTTPGVVNVFEVSVDSVQQLYDNQPGTFSLFTLVFYAGANGTTSLTPHVNGLSDAEGAAMLADALSGTSITVENSPAPVPIPAAAWLLVSGLAGVGTLARRRRAA